jgi:hypothetical protein
MILPCRLFSSRTLMRESKRGVELSCFVLTYCGLFYGIENDA